MKLVGRTNRRLLGNSHGSTCGEGSQFEGGEEQFTWNGSGSAGPKSRGEGAEGGGGDVISTANVGLHCRHRRRRLRESWSVVTDLRNPFLFFFIFFFQLVK